jgi:hypothetical protein
MRQHDLDLVSLFFGLIFLLVSAGYLLTHTTDLRLHWLLAVPAGLIALGIGVLAAVVRRVRQAEQADQA